MKGREAKAGRLVSLLQCVLRGNQTSSIGEGPGGFASFGESEGSHPGCQFLDTAEQLLDRGTRHTFSLIGFRCFVSCSLCSPSNHYGSRASVGSGVRGRASRLTCYEMAAEPSFGASHTPRPCGFLVLPSRKKEIADCATENAERFWCQSSIRKAIKPPSRHGRSNKQ
jgi:hypothetical protein